MRRVFARLARRWSRAARRITRRWPWPSRRSAPADELAPSPGVQAFLAGESMRQIAYFVGSADPGIIDPRDDWPGAVADAHGVVRNYLQRLMAHSKLESRDDD